MKLIIDIPEETYQIIRDTQHLGDSGEATIENVLIRAVEKGEKQRTGHWIQKLKYEVTDWNALDNLTKVFVCSECREWQDHKSRYCPSCGAKMVDPQESEE